MQSRNPLSQQSAKDAPKAQRFDENSKAAAKQR